MQRVCRTPIHPPTNDPRVEDMTAEWIEVADGAASFVIRALQRMSSC